MSIRFTLKQLSYFIAAGEAGSIIRASENIHVSQPSISSAISQLEDQFDIQLFIRHHAQGISLTADGKVFFREAKSLLTQASELQTVAGELSNKIVGTLSIACFNPLAPIIIPELCHRFMSLHEHVDINVIEGHQAEIINSLKDGSIDIALTYDLHLSQEIHFTPLAELAPYVLISKKDPRAKLKEITLSELVNDKLILLDLPLSNEYFMSLFIQDRLKPHIYARTHQTTVQRGLVAKGYGYSLANVRPVNQKSLDGSGLSYLPLKGNYPALTLGIAKINHDRTSKVIAEFITFCQEKVTNDHIPGMIPTR